MKRRVSAIFAGVSVSILSISCAETKKSSAQSAGGAPCVYMQVLETAPSSGVVAYSDSEKSKVIGYAGPKIPVVRELTIDNKSGEKMMNARVGYGTLSGQSVWFLADNLEVRPNYGGCRRELSNVGSYATGLTDEMLRSTVMCSIGFGNGAMGSVKGLAQGLWGMASGVVARTGDMFLLFAGDVEANQRTLQRGQQDEEAAKALGTLLTNAVPMVYNFMQGEYAFFKDLPPARQSEVMCQVLGNISIETLMAAATGGSKIVSQAKSTQGSSIVLKADSSSISLAKSIPSENLNEIRRAAENTKGAEKAVKGAAASAKVISAFERVAQDAMNQASKILTRCGPNAALQPLTCLGLPPGASKSEINSAWKTLSQETHPDIWKGKASQAGGTLDQSAWEKLNTAQAALNKARAAAQ